MIALTFHTECLHDELVWRKLLEFLEFSSKYLLCKPKFTFFVYPFRAIVAGKDIKNRIKALYELGHEIGQHTHFYKGIKIEKPFKENDLSRKNIKYCLNRDFSYITDAIEIAPKGFVAGGWLINNVVMEELINLGFLYDVSYFSKNTTPFIFEHQGKKLLEIPTDCSIGEFFKKFFRIGGNKEYKVIYLHDYDLVRSQVRFFLKLFCLLNRYKKFVNMEGICKIVKL